MKYRKVEGYHFCLYKNINIFTPSSDTFKISKADGVQPGTKIAIHLKPDCREFSDDTTINRE